MEGKIMSVINKIKKPKRGPGKPTNKERGIDEKYPVTTLSLSESLRKKFEDDASIHKWSYSKMAEDIIEWYYELGGKQLRESHKK
jgi:hypothetical protein